MRAIRDSVHLALSGAPPDSLPGGEEPDPEPHEEEHHSLFHSVGQMASHFKSFLEDKLSWVNIKSFLEDKLSWVNIWPAAQPPAALAIEESEVVAEELPEAVEQPQPLALSSAEEVVALGPSAAAPLPAPQPPAALAIEAAEVPSGELALEELLDEARPQRPPVLFSEEGDDAAQDFFLFIKDYGWSLRYRVQQLTDSLLDLEKPLQLEWVKLRRPVHDPDELLSASREELFDWDVREPPSHYGFMYHVTRAVGSGVEAVINFFEGYGLKLLIQPESGIQLTGGPEKSKQSGSGAQDEPRPVTHCWVQVMGMPFLPIVQSIAFFNLEESVIDWSA